MDTFKAPEVYDFGNKDDTDRRKALLATIESRKLDLIESGKDWTDLRAKAYEAMTRPEGRQAFDMSREPARVRERYGMHPLGQNLLLARRLIEAGVRLTSVVAWCGLAPGDKFLSIETWDMHGNAGVDIFGKGWNGLGWALPCCDQAVSALLEDLTVRGLLDTTLVVLVG